MSEDLKRKLQTLEGLEKHTIRWCAIAQTFLDQAKNNPQPDQKSIDEWTGELAAAQRVRDAVKMMNCIELDQYVVSLEERWDGQA